MRSIKYLVFLCLSSILVFSCKQDVSSAVEEVGSMEEEKGLNCQIVVPAGEMYAPFDHLKMPPFFNVGEIKTDTKTNEVIILSERVERGKDLKVDIIGLFGFRQDTINKQYVIALPRQKGVNNLERQYEEYLTKNNDMKLAVESWFRAQCGLSMCGAFYWDNPYKALLQLEQN